MVPFYTMSEVSKYGVFSGLYFPVFGLNKFGRSKSLHSVRIQENTDQKKFRIRTLFTQRYLQKTLEKQTFLLFSGVIKWEHWDRIPLTISDQLYFFCLSKFGASKITATVASSK